LGVVIHHFGELVQLIDHKIEKRIIQIVEIVLKIEVTHVPLCLPVNYSRPISMGQGVWSVWK